MWSWSRSPAPVRRALVAAASLAVAGGVLGAVLPAEPAVSAAPGGSVLAQAQHEPTGRPAQVPEEPLYTFVSMPDFLNTDVGDTRRSPLWEPGDPNSINASWREALDVVLDEVEAEDPDAVLVAGDLVEGRWDRDVDGAGVFGPVNTWAERRAAVRRAGDLYYGQWRERFASRGLPVYAAVGDHELGNDNGWLPGYFKYDAHELYKQVWAGHFTRTAGGGHRFPMRPVGTDVEDTAYAVRAGDTLLVTVDVFDKTATGVHASVRGRQLAWLDGLLTEQRAAGVERVVVQGHTPVLGPVRTFASSGLMHEGGADSAFWRTLRRHRVDLYLSGEVHAITTLTDGVVQVAHGALSRAGRANYLLVEVYEDRMELTLKRFEGRITDSRELWQTGDLRGNRGIAFEPGPATVGSMTIATTPEGPRPRDRRGLLVDAH